MTPDRIELAPQTSDGKEQAVDEIRRVPGMSRISNHRRPDSWSVRVTGGTLWCG